jgi:acetyl-CoA carboxylase biotin carboxyl carrier protein
MSLTYDDVHAILKIIDESPYDEVRLEIGELKLYVRKRGDAASADPAFKESERQAERPTQAPAAVQAPPSAAAPADFGEPAAGLVAVRAPMLGTFYRSPAPGEPPFVQVGARVGADDTVCLVEVMKLFQSVKAGVAGTVIKIQAENGSMVEHGQVLILIESDKPMAEAAIQ